MELAARKMPESGKRKAAGRELRARGPWVGGALGMRKAVERLGGRRGRGRQPGTGRENSVGEGACESPSSEPGVGLGEQ